MIRMPLSAIGGVGLALVLFWLLALLVAPPEEEFEMLEMARPIDVVKAPDAPTEPAQTAPAPEPLPAPPVQATPPPPPPEPAPLSDSELALPEPELVEPEPPVNIDEPLPDLMEKTPDPPAPEPRPEPPPTAEPAPPAVDPPRSAPARQPSQVAGVGSPETSEEPVAVGQVSPLSRVPPEYPRRAQRRGLEGAVELEFVIRRDGRVDPDSLRVIDANPPNVFDKAAREAVKQWRFDPSPRLRRARQRLEFKLR